MVIEPARWADWLDPGQADEAALHALLAPAVIERAHLISGLHRGQLGAAQRAPQLDGASGIQIAEPAPDGAGPGTAQARDGRRAGTAAGPGRRQAGTAQAGTAQGRDGAPPGRRPPEPGVPAAGDHSDASPRPPLTGCF